MRDTPSPPTPPAHTLWSAAKGADHNGVLLPFVFLCFWREVGRAWQAGERPRVTTGAMSVGVLIIH